MQMHNNSCTLISLGRINHNWKSEPCSSGISLPPTKHTLLVVNFREKLFCFYHFLHIRENIIF